MLEYINIFLKKVIIKYIVLFYSNTTLVKMDDETIIGWLEFDLCLSCVASMDAKSI